MRLGCAVRTSEKLCSCRQLLCVRPALHRTPAYVVKSVFMKGVGHFPQIFHREGVMTTNHCRCQKTTVTALSCGIKICVVHYLVVSQYTHLTDRQTDGRNCDSNTVCCITCSHTVKRQEILVLVLICIWFILRIRQERFGLKKWSKTRVHLNNLV